MPESQIDLIKRKLNEYEFLESLKDTKKIKKEICMYTIILKINGSKMKINLFSFQTKEIIDSIQEELKIAGIEKKDTLYEYKGEKIFLNGPFIQNEIKENIKEIELGFL